MISRDGRRAVNREITLASTDTRTHSMPNARWPWVLTLILCGCQTGTTSSDPMTPGLDARMHMDGALERDRMNNRPDVGQESVDARGPTAEPADMTRVQDAQAQDGGRDQGPLPNAMIDASVPDAQSPMQDASRIPDAMAGLHDNGVPAAERICHGGFDEDDDGRIDCEDPDCRGAPSCFDVREICDDGIDNTGDDHIDCDDVTCHLEPGCPPPNVRPFTTQELQDRFDEDCLACHGPPQAEVQLDLSAPFSEAVINVQAAQVDMFHIEPGSREKSWIYQKIRYRQIDFMGDGEGMPPDHIWTAHDAERLGLWIDALAQP